MNDRLHLFQQHLYTFDTCPRRFFLRYLARVPWPEAPLTTAIDTSYEQGRRFHRWIERGLLGLPIMDESEDDPTLTQWWSNFQTSGPPLPAGQQFVETTLTIPIGHERRHTISGRFDLVIIGYDEDEGYSASIFDWKTGDPRGIDRLRCAWQTRVYLAVLTEGGSALIPGGGDVLKPERISFTYWYVEEPERPRVIRYDQATHRQNMAELESLVARIEEQMILGEWPLTNELPECRRCAYQVYCGRQAAGEPLAIEPDEDIPEPVDDWL